MAKNYEQVVLAFFEQFDYDEIEGMRASIAGFASAKRRDMLKEQGALVPGEGLSEADLEELHASFGSDAEFLGEIEALSDEMCILALYKKQEITMTKMLGRFYPLLDKSKLHKIDYVKKNLPFRISTLAGYLSMDELRLINNSIKHNGVVSKALSNYPGWVEKTPLLNLDKAFDRLAPGVRSYVASVCGAIRLDLGL
jgi:hypothetical protein